MNPIVTLGAICLSHWVDTCTDGAQATGLGVQHGARCGTQWPGSTSPRVQLSRKGKHCRFHLSFLAEAVKLLAFKNLNRWGQQLSRFCVTEWKVLEKHNDSLMLIIQGLGKLEKQGNGPSSREFIQLLFSSTPSLLERAADTRGLFRLRFLAAIFSTMNKVSLSLPGKQLRYLLPMAKFELSSKNQNFGKLVSASLTAS